MAAAYGNSDDGGLAPAPAMRQWSEPDFSQLHLLSYETFCEVADQHELQLSNTIDAIKGTIARLRGMRNSRNPHIVRRLPTELLVHIFADVSHPSDLRSSRSLISVTHVCRAWRAIALDTPKLWSNIVVTSLSMAGVYSFIERSRDSLLHLRLQEPRAVVHFRCIIDLQARLHSVTVVADDINCLDRTVRTLARQPSPHLDTLCLLGPNTDRSEPLEHRHPNALKFQEESVPAPFLRCVRLRHMVFPWTSDVYTNLSILDIDTTFLTPPSEEELLDILRRCPDLVELRLRVVGDVVVTGSTRDDLPDVTLPRLSVFSVDGLSPERATSLLSHLELPISTRYKLSLSISMFDAHSGSFAATTLPLDRRRLPGLATIKALTLEETRRDNIRVTLYPSVAQPVTITLRDHTGHATIPFVPTAVLDSLEVLQIGQARLPPEHWNWDEVLDRIVHLRVLRFVQPFDEELMRALEGLMPRRGVLPPVVPCPELEHLELVGVWLTAPELEIRIAEVVRERAENGHPIQLVLRGAVGASAGFLRRLRELGVAVA